MSATSGEEMGEGQHRGRRVRATDQQASDKLQRYTAQRGKHRKYSMITINGA